MPWLDLTFKSNLVDNIECDIPVKGVNNINKVTGIRQITHKFNNIKGDEI